MPSGEVRARLAVASVADPELPSLTLEDLGVVRSVQVDEDGSVDVVLTPTYSGCPALEVMREDTVAALGAAGFSDVQVRFENRPAWTSDDLGPSARQRLVGAGIAPPPGPGMVELSPPCPLCGSVRTRRISRFGSTACKALWRCLDCAEPFEQFKEHR